ncbi:hypothetical protein [Legionella clemsonensis]|uniref:Uncharacterized protein n=1 Tax=Legionella clemsonensis TaxID=1867846 RepID=A0A222P2X4_9GAMM|nr:hypothetical protein [Legionella clemsonensis]ASQ46200.1 hypothetical protein clem_08240 [Legionella clemsonensis]
MSKNWDFLGEGSYNTVYVSLDKRLVLKIPRTDAKTDTPERAIKLWNAINPHLSPSATLIDTEKGRGWICPFIEGTPASDIEISNALIDIYNRTGRIVIDAIVKGNFIKASSFNNQVICVDIGWALQLEDRENTFFLHSTRQKSDVSMETFKKSFLFDPIKLADLSPDYPHTIQILKALTQIKFVCPDIFNVSLLKTNRSLVKMLAANWLSPGDKIEELREKVKAVFPEYCFITNKPYKEQGKVNSSKNVTDIIQRQRKFYLDNIKEYCLADYKDI